MIVNALRVLRPHRTGPQLEVRDAELVEDFRRAHEILRPNLDRVRRAADQIGEIDDVDAVSAVRDVQRFLTDEIAPHEESEDAVMYPVFARVLGGEDPTATMGRAHLEIAHLIRRLGILLDQTDPTAPGRDDLHEMRRILYGLHAILVLHFAQEDESYLSLVDEPGPVRGTPARGLRDEGGRGWSGCAIEMSASARSRSDRPRSFATPNSVTTWSTVFFSVVTTWPARAGRRCG